MKEKIIFDCSCVTLFVIHFLQQGKNDSSQSHKVLQIWNCWLKTETFYYFLVLFSCYIYFF